MKVKFSTAARADIQSIYDFIAFENPSIAANVIASIQNSTLQLELFPLSGRSGAVQGTREVIIPRLPYIVVYQITADAVEIVAVFHAAQDKPRGF